MSYQKEREQFIAQMSSEGLPLGITRLLLREATGLNRRAELACSSEAADRDRVPCPKAKNPKKPCLCDSAEDHNSGMAAGRNPRIPRITLQDWHAEQRIRKALAAFNVSSGLYTGNETQKGLWEFTTEGDPRGYVLKVIPPSYAERNAGRDQFNRDGIGVPSGPSGLRF